MRENLKSAYEKEVNRPFTDNLTGLFNHGFFQTFLDHQFSRAQRYATPFTLGLIDIDSFSFYNQRHSALQGDRKLQEVAGIIKANLRQSDLAARYSGDTFALLMETVDVEAAFLPAERIRQSIAQLAAFPLTVSIGLASYPRDAATKKELLQKVAEALQQAKIRGKNRVYLFEKEKLPLTIERPRILLVEDDQMNLDILTAILTPLNVEVLTAMNGQDAFLLLKRIEVDLILLDIMLPDMDGPEICRRLKGDPATRLIPIIMVTALHDRQSKIAAIEAGADDFIVKPPNRLELLARTKSLLQLKKLNNNLTSIENVLFSLAKSVEAKDVGTQGHIERVANLAVTLGKRMGLSPGKIEALRFGGILHDIGKLGVPGNLINKPNSLNPEENERMQRHPEIGYQICLPLQKALGPALDVIRHHHEKLDGSGYPDRLRGAEISIEARIMAATDMYDALITDRPYRQGLPQATVVEFLRQQALDGKLDATVVATLTDIVTHEGGYEYQK